MNFLKNLFGSQSTEAKNLIESKAQLAAAKTSAEAVAALFTTAGLDLDALLAAGPDALKAHLASLSAKDADLATAQAKVTELEGKNATLTADLTSSTLKFSTLGSALAPVGITAATKPEEFAGLLASHVKKEAAMELAKGGHKPIADVVASATTTTAIDPTLTGLAKVTASFKAQAAAKSQAR